MPSARCRVVIPAALAAVLASCDETGPGPEPTDPWPRTEACEGLDQWPRAWAEHEADVLARMQDVRAEGIDCGARGKLGPAPALRRRAALDCAARSHAADMVEQGYFGRFDLEGRSERERVEAAGYAPAVLVQHIAAGPRDAAELLDSTWLPRPVPCSNLASPALTELGIGHVGDVDDEFGTTWVVVLAGSGDEAE